MPTGMGALLLLSPLLLDWVGWRGSWLVMAMATLAWGLVMALVLRGGPVSIGGVGMLCAHLFE